MPNGQAKAIEPFVTGFLTDGGKTHIARPVGLAMAKDGSLLMADDANGVMYRIAYTGSAGAAGAAAAGRRPGRCGSRPRKGNNVPLAHERPETQRRRQAGGQLAGFAGNAMLDREIQRIRRWRVAAAVLDGGAEGAKSYAIIMEDPDAPAKALRALAGLEHSGQCHAACRKACRSSRA